MTQLDIAVSGKTTEAMRQVSEYEGIPLEEIREKVAIGQIVIPQNIHHEFTARGIGKNLKTKVNANIGTSPSHADLNEELEKLDTAVKAGADAIMDLSTGGDLDSVLATILKHSPVMVGTVPIYKTASKQFSQGRASYDLTADDVQKALGVDVVAFDSTPSGFFKALQDG